MHDSTFFTHPGSDWQRRYEALRASFVDRVPASVVAERFGYSAGYVRLLRHLFRTGKFDLAGPPAEGSVVRRRVSAEIRRKIREWREQRLSAGEIAQLLTEDGFEIGVRRSSSPTTSILVPNSSSAPTRADGASRMRLPRP